MNMPKTIIRDLSLLIHSPVEYLYSFTYSDQEKVTIEPFSQQVRDTGNKLVRKIKKNLPDLTVHFVGSPVFGIPGQRDVDLYVECLPKTFGQNLPVMISLFGTPQKTREKFYEWHFIENDCAIEILFGDPSLPIFTETLKVCRIIGSKREYINEYAKIKMESNGVSLREYKRRRLLFFNRLLKNQN
ncbi:MAG: hypothetical protein M3Q44_06895 [bacterium]|nr:hypothetical protein [bacterium]